MSVLSKIQNITSSKGFKKYFSNTFWLMGEKFFRLGIAMAVSIYVARFLEPVNFGLLNYAKGFVGLFTAFATLGLDKIAVRDLVRDPSKENEITGTAYWLKVMGFGAMMLAIMVSVNFTSNDSFTNTLILIIGSAELFRSFRVIDFVYRSQVRAKVIARVQMVQIVVSSLLKLYLIYIQADLIWFAYIVVFDAIFTASGLILSYTLDNKSIFKWKFSRKTALELVYEAWPLTLYGLALFVQAKIDQVMIKEMMGEQGN
ncbi:MAG: oligosaccharide flippase family protein, partial [Bacteroidota bacterium]